MGKRTDIYQSPLEGRYPTKEMLEIFLMMLRMQQILQQLNGWRGYRMTQPIGGSIFHNVFLQQKRF